MSAALPQIIFNILAFGGHRIKGRVDDIHQQKGLYRRIGLSAFSRHPAQANNAALLLVVEHLEILSLQARDRPVRLIRRHHIEDRRNIRRRPRWNCLR